MRIHHTPAFTVLALAPFLAAGCGAGDRAGAAPVVRDSAGITIVENAAPQWSEAEAWRVASEPEVEIGVLEGDEAYQLYRVAGATRLSDGRIVVANGGTNELRFYDADGRHLRTVGGEGGGPGEFRMMSTLLRASGDSLIVADLFAGRLSLFDAEGGFVKTWAGMGMMRTARARLADGTFLGQAPLRFDGSPDGPVRMPLTIIRFDTAGTVLDTVVTLPGTERDFRMISNDDGRIALRSRIVPFARASYFAVADGRIYAGANDAYQIEVHTPGSGLTRLIRRMRPNRPVTDDVIDRFRQVRLAAADDDDARRAIEQQLADAKFPETMPAFSDLAVDAAGNLWVEDYSMDDDNRWDVFDPDGVWLGTVPLPPGLEPYEIGEDYVLGGVRDEFDVERVRLYRIDKRE